MKYNPKEDVTCGIYFYNSIWFEIFTHNNIYRTQYSYSNQI